MRGTSLIVTATLALAGLTPVLAPAPQDDADPARAEAQAEREQRFRELLTGAELIGHFTLDGAPDDAPLREERYSIAAVTKRVPLSASWTSPAR